MSLEKAVSRRKFLSLAGLVGACGVVSACNSAATASPTTTPLAQSQPPQTSEPVATPTPAEAVTLTYMNWGFAAQFPDLATVEAALNRLTQEKINAKLKLVFIELPEWTEKMNLMNAGGEQYDLCLTANWTNDYYKNVVNGQFVALDELLPVLAPGLWQSLPADTWAAARVKGKLYAVINQGLFATMYGFIVRKELIAKYKLDMDAIQKWVDLEPWLDAVLKGEGYPPFNIYPDLYWPEIAGAATIDSSMNWAQVPKDDHLARVENSWTTPRFTDTWALKKRWYEAGYIVRDMPRIGEDRAGWAAGKAAIGNWFISPGGEFDVESVTNCEIVQKSLTDPFLTTASTTGAMVGVSRTTNSKEAAVKWLEHINTDPATYNLLCFGIEGKHWNWKDKAKLVIEQVTNSTYNPMSNWMFGNVFNSYYRNERQVGAWEECRRINDTAPRSTVLGFSLERESLKNEIAAVTAMLGEWSPYGEKGRSAAELPKAVEQMNAAGAATILTEIQRQIDEWRQNG